MASSWTHAAAAVAIASVIVPRGVRPRTWLLVGVAAAVPDLDAIGRLWGSGDVQWLGGHRAFTHSLVFAVVFGGLLSLTLWRTLPHTRAKAVAFLAFTLAVASHGAIDALTSYGEGIEFLSPFTNVRYWATWRLVGDGIVRDTIAFVVFYLIARAVIIRRRLPLPSVLNPQFLRATG